MHSTEAPEFWNWKTKSDFGYRMLSLCLYVSSRSKITLFPNVKSRCHKFSLHSCDAPSYSLGEGLGSYFLLTAHVILQHWEFRCTLSSIKSSEPIFSQTLIKKDRWYENIVSKWWCNKWSKKVVSASPLVVLHLETSSKTKTWCSESNPPAEDTMGEELSGPFVEAKSFTSSQRITVVLELSHK